MRLSSLNIWRTFKERRAQQKREVASNADHPVTVWDMREHTGWGDSIQWMNWDTRRLSGHTTPLPQVGDELRALMHSGRVGTFRFTKVDPCYDPSDMWFATVDSGDYLEEPTTK